MRLQQILLSRFLWLLLAGSLPGQTFVQVRVDHANAREEPDSNATILAVLHRGEVRPLVEDVPYWYGITLRNGRTAYVAKRFCTAVWEEAEEETDVEIDQPLDQLYVVPPAGSTVTVPNCTSQTLSLDPKVCPAEGTGGTNWLANVQKNRTTIPCSYASTTLAEIRSLRPLPRNVRSLAASDPRGPYLLALESRPVVVEAHLAMVKRGGAESTNCNSSSRKDLHMDLVASDAGDPKNMRAENVVAEVTPWFSETFTGWTTSTLGPHASYRGGYSGAVQGAPARVRIYGWLFFDNWHAGDGSVGTWRGTAWEIHPITRIEVLENGTWRNIQ